MTRIELPHLMIVDLYGAEGERHFVLPIGLQVLKFGTPGERFFTVYDGHNKVMADGVLLRGFRDSLTLVMDLCAARARRG